MTKQIKQQWSQMTADYLTMYNAGVLNTLPDNVQQLMSRMAAAMQDTICADSRAKMKAQMTRNENNFWRTF